MKESIKKYDKLIILIILLTLASVFYIAEKIEYLFITLLLIVVDSLYNIYKSNQLQKSFSTKVDNISKYLTNSIEKNIQNNVYPVAIIKDNGDIIWNNKKFHKELNSDKNPHYNILNIIRGVSLDKLIKQDTNIPHRINLKGKIYDVYAQKIEFVDEKESFIIYFNDVTYLKSSTATKESIMLIEVDNLSDVVKSMEDDNGPLLVAEVERTINNYASNLGAMIRKYESNKYVLSVSNKLIEEQIKKKFDILDAIRDIDMGNKIDVTLSIGVGIGENSSAENHSYAVTAKELALGRGGDQAVVKWKEKISFFGGNTKELEKRTRVRARVVARALKDLVYESSKVYIMGHKNPDMDCFGSAFGLSSAIKQLGKECKIILGNDNRNIEFFMEEVNGHSKYDDLFISAQEAVEKIDKETLVIIVDVHNSNYVQDIETVNKAQKLVIIDHHRRSPDMIEGALLNFIEIYASSTSELVTEVVQYMLDKPKLETIEAEALLAGIFIDTKNFIFKTGVRTFEAASFLRRLGADTIHIKKLFSDDLENYIKKAETIKSAEVENNMAIATCPPETTEIVLAAQAADDLLNITGIQASFVFVKIEGEIYISARSLGDINVQVILEALGGGGHMTMAGAKLSDLTIAQAKEKLKKAIKNYLKEGE